MVPEKTPNLKLKKPDYENGVADIRIFNENWDILDGASKKIENEMTETNDKVDNGLKTKLDKGSYEGDADDLKREIDGKEPAFEKNSGFNKEKTDSYNENDTNKLFTQKGANDLKNEVDNKVSKNGDRMTGFFGIYNGTLEVDKKYDFDGYPSKDASDPNNYTNSYIQKYSTSNNSMYVIGDGEENARKFGIQVGHRDKTYANSTGTLDLNPLGGDVKINNNIAWHTGNFNPDDKFNVSGGTIHGPVSIDAKETQLYLKSYGKSVGKLQCNDTDITLENTNGGKAFMVLKGDGKVLLNAINLKTNSKEVIMAINEIKEMIGEIQAGVLVLDSPLGSGQSVRVDFKKPFREIPVVVVGTMSGNMKTTPGDSSGGRVMDVDRGGFTYHNGWARILSNEIRYVAMTETK